MAQVAGSPVVQNIINVSGGGGGAVGQVSDRTSTAVNRTARSYKKLSERVVETNLNLARFVVIMRRVLFAFISMKAISFAISLFSSFTDQIIKGNAQFEVLHARLTQFFGDTVKAGRAFKFIVREAITTPFEIPNLTQAATVLKSFGLSVSKNLRLVADTAAANVGVGEDLNQVIVETAIRFGKVAAGSAQYRRILPTLRADQAKFNEVLAATGDRYKALVASLSRFRGMSERLSATVIGRISNINDILGILGRRLGALAFEEIKADIRDLFNTLEGAPTGKIDQLSIGIRNFYISLRRMKEQIVSLIPVIKQLAQVFITLFSIKIATGLVGTFLRGVTKLRFAILLAAVALKVLIFDLDALGVRARSISRIISEATDVYEKFQKIIKSGKLESTTVQDITNATIILSGAIETLQDVLDKANDKFAKEYPKALKEAKEKGLDPLRASIIAKMVAMSHANLLISKYTDNVVTNKSQLEALIDKFKKMNAVLNKANTSFEDSNDILLNVSRKLKSLRLQYRDISGLLRDLVTLQRRYNVKLNDMAILQRVLKPFLGDNTKAMLDQAKGMKDFVSKYVFIFTKLRDKIIYDIIPSLPDRIMKNLQESQKVIKEGMSKIITLPPQQQLVELEKLQAVAAKMGFKSLEEAQQGIDQLFTDRLTRNLTANLNLAETLSKLIEQLLYGDVQRQLQQFIGFVQGLLSPITEMWGAMISGTQKFGEIMKRTLQSIISQLLSLVTRAFLLMTLFKLLPGSALGFFPQFGKGGFIDIIKGLTGAGAIGALPAAGGNANPSVSQSVVIPVAVTLDGREIARAVYQTNLQNLG